MDINAPGLFLPVSLDLEAYDSSMVCGSSNLSTEWDCGFHYFCRLGGGYLFSLEGIELVQKAEGCRVTYWSEPCEAFGNEIFDEKCR